MLLTNVVLLTYIGFLVTVKCCRLENLYYGREYLECSNTNLGTLKIDEYPLNMTTVGTLSLRNTGLESLEGNVFSHFTQLLFLDLSYNSLQSLHHLLFSNLTLLVIMHLNNNQITNLTDGRLFESQKYLRELHLQYNKITTISLEVFNPLVSLKRLYLEGNQFRCDCHFKETVLWIQSKCLRTHATCQYPLAQTGRSVLNIRDLICEESNFSSNGNFSNACEQSCIFTEIYKKIDCTNVRLNEVHANAYPLNRTDVSAIYFDNMNLKSLEYDVFNNLFQIRYLYLSNNKLTALDYRVFHNLFELLYIGLTYNKLTFLDKRLFLSQHKLQDLWLIGNRLKHLSREALEPLVSLKVLYISYNPFECDCDLRETMLWANKSTNVNDGYCYSPIQFYQEPWYIMKEGLTCNLSSEKTYTIVVATVVPIALTLVAMCCLIFRYKRRRAVQNSTSHYDDVMNVNDHIYETIGPRKAQPIYLEVLPNIPDRPNCEENATNVNMPEEESDRTSDIYVLPDSL